MLRIWLLILSVITFWMGALALFLFITVAIKIEPLFWIVAALCMLGQYASIKVFKEQWERNDD